MKYWDMAKACMTSQQEIAYTINDTLAKNPEVSGQEKESSSFICNTLEKAGMPVERALAGIQYAFRAEAVKSTAAGAPKLAILCEYDALPNIGHGCGHSASGSVSVLAALTLHELNKELLAQGQSGLPMNVDIIGTPDEELTGGKIDLVNAGVFNDYDFAIMVHMDGVETRANSDFLALDDYRIVFHGKPAHAAGEPWNGVNALNGMQLALNAIDMLRQQVRPEVRIGYYVVAGGRASNIIPDYAEFECCIRHTDRTYLDTVVAKVMNCVAGAALATGTTYEITQYGHKFDNMAWNETGTELINRVLTELDFPHVTGRPTDLGSSDIGNVSKVCPAFHPNLRLKGEPKVCHTKEFAAAMLEPTIKETITEGAQLIAKTLLTLMEEPEVLKAIKEEFNSSVKH